MDNVLQRVKEEQCCGCGACYNKCPVGAISMVENEEGFLNPVIDENKCTNCGLCLAVCPSLNVTYKNNSKPKCYAAMASDEIRMKSSSGGVFTLLAENILDKGGYVCGAAFDKDWNVHHIIINDKKELDKLRGSKYVQSDIGNCYSEIRNLLNNNKYVLFSGCPCQVAGLYSFLGKEYEKLYTVDVLCHGAPSPGVWRKYLNETFEKNSIKNINFRDKEKIGWSCSHCSITLNNNKKIVSDEYTRLFHKSIILRKTCQYCEYSQIPRIADITLGDFWGISNYKKEINDEKGVSFLLINSTKGKILLDDIKEYTKCTEIHLKNDYNNGNIIHGTPLSPLRNLFFLNFNRLSFNKCKKAILDKKFDICLITTFFADNYGAILVAYAANKLIENLGYSCLMLQKPKFLWSDNYYGDTIPQVFARKHYNISRIYNSYKDLWNLNNICQTFITGSDQLFKPYLKMDYSFLSWVEQLKNKISFGTSFGEDSYNQFENNILKKQYYLNRFNHIALREKGENLCNNIFNISADEIIDPTLILPIENYLDLIPNSKLKIDDSYILVYFLDSNQDKENIVRYISQKLNLKIVYIHNLEMRSYKNKNSKTKKKYTPEEFLSLYYNSSFVVTDSYHGTCFSIKFNKPFISIINEARGGLRYKMFDKLKISDHIVANIDDIYNNLALLEPIDYTLTNKIVKKEADYAINWLCDSINNNLKNKFSLFENYIDMILQKQEFDIEENKKDIALLKIKFNSPQIFFSYYRYKLLSTILLGSKRKHYQEKRKIYHEKVRKIRSIEKSI